MTCLASSIQVLSRLGGKYLFVNFDIIYFLYCFCFAFIIMFKCFTLDLDKI